MAGRLHPNNSGDKPQSFIDRILVLSPRLHRIAAHNVGTCSEYDAEDLYQTMVLKLLERVAMNPDFANRSDAELLIFAEWRSRHKAEAGRTYSRYVHGERVEEGISELDVIPSASATPEEICIHREAIEIIERATRKLTPRNRQIIRMLAAGYLQTEIAAEMKVTKGRITQIKGNLARYARMA